MQQYDENFFPNNPNLVLTINRKGVITRVNPAGLKIARFRKEEMIGTKFYKLPGVFKKENIMDYFLIFFKGIILGKGTHGYIGSLNDGEGNPHLLEFDVYPIRMKNKVKELLVIMKDLIKIEINQEKPSGEKIQVKDEYKIYIPSNVLETKPGDVINFKLTEDGEVVLEKDYSLSLKSSKVLRSRFNIK